MERENENYIISSEFQVLRLLIDLDPDEGLEAVPSIFPHEIARAVREAILILKDNKETINESSLFGVANKILDTVDVSTIRSILECKVDRSNWATALETLRIGSVKYNLKKTLENLVTDLSTPDDLDHTKTSDALYTATDILAHGGKKLRVKTLEECLTDYEEELENRRDGRCYFFGDLFLDRVLTRKAAPGQIITIVGTTGMGKSGFTLNLINSFINMGVPSMYFSLEMDEISTTDRLMAMREGIPIGDWYEPANINSLLKRVEKQKGILANKPYAFIDDPGVSLDIIRSEIRAFKLLHRTEYAIVFVDLITQVQDFMALRGNTSLATIIEMAINKESAISKLENVCFVNVAQLNRETDSAKINSIEDIESFRPTLTQIKNSNAIGERSRTVLSVFRPKYYADRMFPNDPEVDFMEDILEVQVMKQNQGPAGPIGKYLFEGPTMSLKPYIETEATLHGGNGE